VDMCPDTDVSVITNVTPNHLDIHSSYDEYKTAKSNILKRASEAVISLDSCEAMALTSEFLGRCITYATVKDASSRVGDGCNYVYCKDGFIYRNREEILPISDIRLRGEFNILNVCLAIGAAYSYVKPCSIREAVKEFSGVRCRMELIERKNGVSYYDSSIDSTPSRTVATMSSFDRERVVLLLGGYDKKLCYDSLKEGLRGVKCAIICGANSEKIYNAIRGSCKVILQDSFTESVKIAYRMAEAGDSVILSPASASYDMFTSYREKSKKYREIVRGL